MSLIIDYPWYFIVLCLLLGVAYAAALYWLRRRRDTEQTLSRPLTITLSVLRALSVAAIAFLFLAPLVKREASRKEKPIVVIAQDNSKSLDYCPDSAFYHTDYQQQLDRLADNLSGDYDVHRVSFGSEIDAEGTELTFSEPSTDIAQLVSGIAERYYHRNIGALVVATDGIYNAGSNPLGATASLTFPVYTVAMGDTTIHRDASIANVRFNRVAYLGNSFPMDITVNANQLKGETATLTVSCDGRKLHSRQIAINDARFSATESFTVDADRAGLHNYIVEIAPLGGEQSLRNNRRVVPIEVIDGHQKIAIIAAVPHPDIAALRSAIDNNQNYETEVFMAKDFAKNPRDYNLLIFHQLPTKVAESNIDVAALLKSGTPALFVLGSQTDLARLNNLHAGLEIYSRIERQNEASPLINKNFTYFTLPDDAAKSIAQFPPLSSPFGDYKLGANGQALLNARIGSVNSGLPLIAVTQQSSSRYAFIAGEGLWRWRLADWQSNQAHSNFNTLIDKIVVFTALRANNEKFHIDAKNIFGQSEAVTFDAQLYNDNYEPVNIPDVELTVRRAGEQDKSYTFNRTVTGYSLNIGILPPGSYSYNATTRFNGKSLTASGSFLVEDLQLEAMNTVADHSLLRTMATTTGGTMVAARELEQIGKLLRERDDMKTLVFSETSYSDMLNLPLIFIIIVLLLAVEWITRKYHGEV